MHAMQPPPDIDTPGTQRYPSHLCWTDLDRTQHRITSSPLNHSQIDSDSIDSSCTLSCSEFFSVWYEKSKVPFQHGTDSAILQRFWQLGESVLDKSFVACEHILVEDPHCTRWGLPRSGLYPNVSKLC